MQDNVDRLIEQAHAELVRVDSKAQGVLTVAGLVFAAGAAVVGQADLPTVAYNMAAVQPTRPDQRQGPHLERPTRSGDLRELQDPETLTVSATHPTPERTQPWPF